MNTGDLGFSTRDLSRGLGEQALAVKISYDDQMQMIEAL